MSTAEKIYEQVKGLPQPVIKEILDFVEFVSRKADRPSTGEPADTAIATKWPDIVLKFKGEPDFPPFESARSQLVAPAEDPLS